MIRFRSNTTAVVSSVAAMRERARNPGPMLEALGDHMVNASIPQTFAAQGRPTTWAKNQRGGQTGSNTARLRRSLAFEVNAGRLKVGTNVRYGAQFHFGGLIKAKPGKALAIPLDGRKGRPRAYAGLVWHPGAKDDPKKKGLLGKLRKRRGGKVEFTAYFALRTEVTQPARPFLVWHPEDIEFGQRTLIRYVTTGSV